MEIKSNRGTTLIELVVYFALSALALGLVVALFTVLRRTGEHTYAQYLVSGNMATTMRMIRKELQATPLASINSFGANAGEEPGFSCVSAYDDEGDFKLGSYGTPHWQKHVSYRLGGKGRVTRSTKDITDKNYLPTLAPAPNENDKGRVLMTNALVPGKTVGEWQPATTYGGLEVGFVRRDGATETVVPQNPRDSGEPEGNTRLVQIVMRTYDERDRNFLEIKFRVCPRY